MHVMLGAKMTKFCFLDARTTRTADPISAQYTYMGAICATPLHNNNNNNNNNGIKDACSTADLLV